MKKQTKKTKIKEVVEKNVSEIDVDGTVTEALPNAMFRVRLDNDAEVLCTISGKIRIHKVRILPDDRVQVGLSIYDMNRGRIKFRYKN